MEDLLLHAFTDDSLSSLCLRTLICANVVVLVAILVKLVFNWSSRKEARAASERENFRCQIVDSVQLQSDNRNKTRERDQMKDALKESEEKRERLVVDAAATGARLVDLRAWEKAVKRFFSALKGSNASDRTVLCKDPEGVIEKLLEGKSFIDVMRDRKPCPVREYHEVRETLDELDLADAKVRLKTLKAENKSLAAENERLRARVKELEASQ